MTEKEYTRCINGALTLFMNGVITTDEYGRLIDKTKKADEAENVKEKEAEQQAG